MRLRIKVTVPPLTDVELARRVVPHLLSAVRAVPVSDGAPVDVRGRRCSGVQVAGAHPRPGTTYTAAAPPARTQGEVEAMVHVPVEAEAELVALRRRGEWDAVDAWYRQWEPPGPARGGTPVTVRLRSDTRAELGVDVLVGPTRAEVDVVDPQRAEAVVVRVSGEVATGKRFVDGPVSGDATVRLDRLPPHQGRRPQVTATGTHRRGTGSLRLWVRQDGGLWRVTVRIRVRGRGLLRPVVFLAGLFGRRWIERAMVDELAMPATGGAAMSDLRAVFGSDPDPAEIADVILERLLLLARPDR